ncbi:DENN domain-containing protein 2D-like [Scleropages formosus]|uniref:DENN domain-containing protein 2D-like n=1 Tax=Scleropages formosus TaxID=113540 RepID=A0A0P7VER6_SCLFO|nr:DENN domain-containing protein 2D-like [Scleropages formosus]
MAMSADEEKKPGAVRARPLSSAGLPDFMKDTTRSTITPSEDNEEAQGPLKMINSLWSSFQRKLSKNSECPSGGRDKLEVSPPITPSVPKVLARKPTSHSCSSSGHFFEYLVVVSLQKKGDGTYGPKITYQFPKREGMVKFQMEEEQKTLKAITLFCFPEGVKWAPLTEYRSETFSFVLTEIDGSRKNGYCRRLLPQGKGARSPEAYCIISQLACFGLFSKISMAMIYPFMQSLREAQFPAPGETVRIKSFIPESGTEDEHAVQVFAAAVLERRIIFVAEELSTLSQVIHAVVALLYPFSWQHTFISIVPEILIDVVMAPTPYLLGVQKHLLDFVTDQSDLLIVDLCEGAANPFITSIGDERDILPPKLQEDIFEALSTKNHNSTAEEFNKIVSDAFLAFFVKTVGHFAGFIRRKRDGHPGVFDKQGFCKAVESKNTRKFVEKFIKTQMFDVFIQEAEQQSHTQEGFFQKKIAENLEKKKLIPRKL